MRHNKVETAVHLFHMSHAVLAGFSGHVNSVYDEDGSNTNHSGRHWNNLEEPVSRV